MVAGVVRGGADRDGPADERLRHGEWVGRERLVGRLGVTEQSFNRVPECLVLRFRGAFVFGLVGRAFKAEVRDLAQPADPPREAHGTREQRVATGEVPGPRGPGRESTGRN